METDFDMDVRTKALYAISGEKRGFKVNGSFFFFLIPPSRQCD